MRRSGEVEAVGDEDGADDERRDERTSSVDRNAISDADVAPPRPYPLWTKVETGKRRLPPTPAQVSRGLWARLARHIVACLRQRVGSLRNLRSVVRAVSAEMRLAGASREEVETALR